ncbi:MAG: hypothetical protein WAV40_04570, partial [Microgenomates group bacterium]
MKKRNLKKPHSKPKLAWILASTVIILAGISYFFIKANTVSPSINKLTDVTTTMTPAQIKTLCRGDQHCIDTYNVSTNNGTGGTQAISTAEKIAKYNAKAENPEFCSGGSGVKFPPGSYIPSGGGWEADGTTTCTN